MKNDYDVVVTRTMTLSLQDMLTIMEHVPTDSPLYRRVKFLTWSALTQLPTLEKKEKTYA